MTFFTKIYDFMFYESVTPKLFGWFHIVSVILVALLAIVIFKLFGNADDKTLRRFLFAVWIVLILGEIYREVCFSLDIVGGVIKWDYAWFIFPFQMCSAPLYSLPFVIFLPDSKVRDGFIAFLSFFAIFGGLVVMFYPGDLFIGVIGSNVQSILHHGMQLIIGMLLTWNKKSEINIKHYLKGSVTFLAFVCVAMILNVSVYHIFQANGISDTFNMFYISPYFNCTLPVLSLVTQAVGNWIGAPLYVLVYLLIGFIIYTASRLIVKKISK